MYAGPDSAVPIVLVHGIGVSGRYLLPTARLLGGRHAVYVPDLIGFGKSSRPRHALTLVEHAEVLAQWVRGAGLPPAVFVGNSAGCQVLVELAARHPALVERLVLTGPTVDAHARNFWRQLGRLLADTVREPLALVAIIAADYASAGSRRVLLTALDALRDRPEEKLPRVQAPTLVVRGERDALVSQRWAEEVAGHLPRGRLVVVPGAPHAVNYAAPSALVREILAFLDD